MLNPYDGTLGLLFNRDKLEEQLKKYVINNPEPLNYEIKENDPDKVKVVCILGKNEEEKQIEPFNHPYIFKDIRGKTVVAMDFRLFTKSNVDDNVIDITDALSDKINGKIALTRLIFTKIMLEGNVAPMLALNSYISESFAALVDTIITNMVYDKNVTDPAHMVSLFHYYSMDDGISNGFMNDKENYLSVEEVLYRLPMKEASKLKNNLTDLYNKMVEAKQEGEFVLPSRTINDLVNNIIVVGDNPRLDKMDVDIFINGLSKTFFCLNNRELAIALAEHKPTMISIFYIMTKEAIGSRSLVRKVIEGRKNITKPKDMIKTVEQIIEDNLHKI
jgi:hypothetical protein